MSRCVKLQLRGVVAVVEEGGGEGGSEEIEELLVLDGKIGSSLDFIFMKIKLCN